MKIKKWAQRQLAAITLAMTSVEKNILSQEGGSISEGSNQERRHQQGSMLDALVRGELTAGLT